MDAKVLDVESVQSMLRFLPTSDELTALNMYEGEEERLAKADRYFRKLGKVAGFESKLRALEFKQGFTAAVNAIHDWTGVIDSCSRELKASTRMGRLIALVLNLGNHLNSAGRRRRSTLAPQGASTRLNSALFRASLHKCLTVYTTFVEFLHHVCRHHG